VAGRGAAAGTAATTPTSRSVAHPAGRSLTAAHRLGLSHSTVKHHLANARFKVGAETTAQLVWILAPRLPEPEGGAETDE
jgi:DNA-binding NarL/FixJ family response regulator